MHRILVVDDVEINRDILSDILSEEYEIVTADNGLTAIEAVKTNAADLSLILLDLIMPEMDGFEVLKWLASNHFTSRIPVVVITEDYSVASASRCYENGVVDFIRKPFEETLVKLRVNNVIDLYSYKNDLEDRIAIQTEKLQKQNQTIIDILGNVVESRNLESGQHIQRVKYYTRVLATSVMKEYPEYGLSEADVELIAMASALHDVGKIAIPDDILLKPGRLTDKEFSIMKEHTTRGCAILENIEGAWDEEYAQVCYEICRHHHEKYDGRGYPDGLVGDAIPIAAQIVSVADVYDALVNERVYKDAFDKDTAYMMIITGECGAFSDKLMRCFGLVRTEFEMTVCEM